MNTVETMLENVKRIFVTASQTVESMALGERMQIKDLTQKVALAVSMEPRQVLGFVNYFAHNTDLAYVSRGKNGGLVRGTRPAKTA